MKYRSVVRALKGVFAAVLVTSLFSCGGGGSTNVVSDTSSSSASTSAGAQPSSASSSTSEALAIFWDRYGAETSFPPMYGDVLTKLLDAEDKVFADDYLAARKIIDALIAKYPLMDNSQPDYNVWWGNYYYAKGKDTPKRPHLGEPGPYAHLRMLDEITRVGINNPMLGKTPIQMAIVMPVCTDITPETGPTLVNQPLNPEIEADDYKVVRQSLRLFQSYLLAISGGELNLKLNFYKINNCFQINKEKNYLKGNYNEPLLQLPKGVAEKTDMFWLIYPNNIDKGAKIEFSSGIGKFYGTDKPVFMSEDDWIIKKRAPDQGVGSRTEVERRMYLPEWFQHEFFHHLFASWPELKLEGSAFHEYYDRTTWPQDFNGKIAEDYYSESLRNRLYKQPISIAQMMQRANK